MGQITNGTVGYERVVKDADYGVNRKASASLSFTFADGEDTRTVTAYVSQEVIRIAHGILSGKPSAKETAETAKVGSMGSPPAPSPEPAVSAALKQTDKDKLAEAAGVPASAAPSSEKKRGRPPSAKVEEAKSEDPLSELNGPTAASPEPSDDLSQLLDAEPKPEPIKDAELGEAVRRKMANMPAAGAGIKKLIYEYVTPPKTIVAIPAEKRQEFLDKLKDLKV